MKSFVDWVFFQRIIVRFSSLVFLELSRLLSIQSVDDPLLPFSPQSIQFIEKQFILWLCELPLSLTNEVLPETVNFFWNPEWRLWYEVLVTGTKMKRFFCHSCIKWGFLVEIRLSEEFHTIIHKSEFREVLILCRFLQHFEHPPMILSILLYLIS